LFDVAIPLAETTGLVHQRAVCYGADMARVCPNCRRMVGDDELACSKCGAMTLDTTTWRDVRPSQVDTPISPKDEAGVSEHRLKVGLGGMLAVFTFFIVYLIAYLVFLR
jgi:hypothetical protein